MLYGGTRYYYVKNLQGDITMLVDENGSVAAKYTYDHQGAVVSVLRGNGAPATDPYHIANLNPLRYRGYVYDTDSGLYYLQSRYYDPDTGRFINADVYCDTATGSPLSTNMFAYCENNPVNASDYNGYYLITFTYKMLSNLILSMLHINLAVHVLSYWSWNYNYENNRLYYTGTYITNQKTSIISTIIRLGFFTGDYNGCGWIATYNALRFLGCKNIQPYNIVSFYDSWGILLYGAFGILPDAVADYFRHLGYSNVDIKLCIGNSGIDRFIANHRVAIVFYIHSSGGHYVMVYREKKQFYSYNMFSNFSGRYSHGSSFEKTLNERGRVAVAVIGIK